MTLMQVYWSAYKPVDFGHEEARNKIPCSKDKTTLVFRELQQRGFIVKVDEAIFSSRNQGKVRTWRLTWLPFGGREPTNNWEK